MDLGSNNDTKTVRHTTHSLSHHPLGFLFGICSNPIRIAKTHMKTNPLIHIIRYKQGKKKATLQIESTINNGSF